MVATGRVEARPPLPAFGRLLKDLRIAADLTQEELAERAGVSARLVSDLERGVIHRPRRDTVKMLADALDLSGSERDSFAFLARGKVLGSAEPLAKPVELHIPTLPSPAHPIIGRRDEISTVLALLLKPEVRLLTLTGPGGVGKTRLALEVAHSAVPSFRDGAFFVDLAPLQDPELVPTAIAQALSLRPKENQSVQEVLVEFLNPRRVLLLLDNFEHLTDAAAAISELLAACPGLKVLATSRTMLNVQMEREFQVAPLQLPNLDQPQSAAVIDRISAVELFVERATQASAGFALTNQNAPAIAEIAVRLDGLPLAIELAAARMKIMSPSALRDRLERRLPLLTGGPQDAPARQRTVRSTIDWSHELLSDEERRLFRRLAAFTGGCTLDAAEAVARTSESNWEIFDALTGLIEKSLLRVSTEDPDGHRFIMLETIREYGVERLTESGEEQMIRNRHAAWYVKLAEEAEPGLTGADRETWITRLNLEQPNIRSAINWSIAQGDFESALRIGGSIFRFWAMSGRFEEARVLLDLMLSPGRDSPPELEAKALQGAGVLAHFRGDYDQATDYWERALALNRIAGNKFGIGASLGNLGLAADDKGDFDRAAALYSEALEIFREVDDRVHVNFMLNNLGVVAYMVGDYERSTSLLEQCLALSHELGDPDAVALAICNLGFVALLKGELDRAISLQTDALKRRLELTNEVMLVKSLENFAIIAGAIGEPVRLAKLFGAAEVARERLGTPIPLGDREFNLPYIDRARKSLGDDAFAAAWAEGRQMQFSDAIEYTLNGASRAVR